jgi:hypothetical protein
MKLTTIAHLSAAVALCAGGLLTIAPAAAALPSLPTTAGCDPRPRPVVQIVDDLLKGKGQDCADVDPGPSSNAESGTAGGDAVVRGDPSAEEPHADPPADAARADNTPAEGNNNAGT